MQNKSTARAISGLFLTVRGVLSKTGRTDSSFCSAVIAAAGSSHRCGDDDKLLSDIGGKPVLAHTIEAFEACSSVNEIIITARRDQIEEYANIVKKNKYVKVSKIIVGGETRTESVYIGVFAVSDKAGYIAIHDGARPLVDSEIIEETLSKAKLYHAAAPGVPVISTIKRATVAADGNKHGKTIPVSANGKAEIIIAETVDREALFEIQTPQIFKADIIKAALTNAMNKSITLTDDCMAAEILGIPVCITKGKRRNMKITISDDFAIAEALLKN